MSRISHISHLLPRIYCRHRVEGGLTPVLAGLIAGVVGAIALTRFIESILFATSPLDVPTLFGVSTLFLVVGIAACFMPAWRAARIDPMSAPRQE